MEPDEIRRLIADGLTCEEVSVNGDGRHFEAVVVSADFEGKASLARHRMVYATLGSKMGNEIHALGLRTVAPGEID